MEFVKVSTTESTHFNCNCIGCGKKMAATHETVWADLHGKPFVDYYCDKCRFAGCITRELLVKDVDRNGINVMLSDVAVARATGVRFSADAEEYLRFEEYLQAVTE